MTAGFIRRASSIICAEKHTRTKQDDQGIKVCTRSDCHNPIWENNRWENSEPTFTAFGNISLSVSIDERETVRLPSKTEIRVSKTKHRFPRCTFFSLSDVWGWVLKRSYVFRALKGVEPSSQIDRKVSSFTLDAESNPAKRFNPWGKSLRVVCLNPVFAKYPAAHIHEIEKEENHHRRRRFGENKARK